MKFTNTITIDRSPADVFAYLSRFENVPRWNEAIVDTRRTSQGPSVVGSTYVQTRSQPSPGEDSFEVTAYEPDQSSRSEGRSGVSKAPLPTNSNRSKTALASLMRWFSKRRV